MSTELRALCEFGPFRLDPENRLLLREGRPVPLTPKVFDALLLLVERSGRLVLKDDLMKALWPGTFVDESNLTQTVFMLRKALGETGSEQRYVVTVPGRGYRFAARVQQVSLAQFLAAREMDPTLHRTHLLLYAYVESGRFADALDAMKDRYHFWPTSYDMPWMWVEGVYVYRRSGKQALAQHAMEELERVNWNGRPDMTPALARMHAAMNNKNDALVWLEKAYRDHSNALTDIKVDPLYDSLRSDPRFQELQRRVGLAP